MTREREYIRCECLLYKTVLCHLKNIILNLITFFLLTIQLYNIKNIYFNHTIITKKKKYDSNILVLFTKFNFTAVWNVKGSLFCHKSWQLYKIKNSRHS
jgi:hypothetical protein